MVVYASSDLVSKMVDSYTAKWPVHEIFWLVQVSLVLKDSELSKRPRANPSSELHVAGQFYLPNLRIKQCIPARPKKIAK